MQFDSMPGRWKSEKEPLSGKHVCASRSNSQTEHGTTDWFKTGKGVSQGCIMSPCLFNLYAEYIMQNAELDQDCWEKYQ